MLLCPQRGQMIGFSKSGRKVSSVTLIFPISHENSFRHFLHLKLISMFVSSSRCRHARWRCPFSIEHTPRRGGRYNSTILTGQTISHYKILDKLGEGGMGVVYKAEDTRLDRPVALKFLPTHLLGDAEVRKRFEREAKASAALSHSNVCTVHEIDEADGKTFIAMEFIEGKSLDSTIAEGPLKIEQALDIAQQVAKGLEAAHKKGIVHRDIKPQNIMIADDGHVTIMDFGLAQLTQASLLTRPDQTMGTTFYMSPEQTEGSGTDHRTDIWALGVVIYEMITSQRPFKGDYDKAVMYSILNEEPEPITGLRTGVPVPIEALVGKCLAKSAVDRYQHADELLVDLRAIARQLESGSAPSVVRTGVASPPAGSPGPRWPAFYALAGLCVLLAGFSTYLWQREAAELPVRHFTIDFDQQVHHPVISPDGRYIAYIVGDRIQDPASNGTEPGGALWIHDLRSATSRLVEEAGDAVVAPFWSPDSAHLAFNSERGLLRAAVVGGAIQTVASTHPSTYYGGCWSPDGGWIIYSNGAPSRLYRVPATGGEPKEILQRDSFEIRHWLTHPRFPYGSAAPRLLSFNVYDSLDGGGELLLADLDTGDLVELTAGTRHDYDPAGRWILDRFDLNSGWQLLAAAAATGDNPVSEEPFVLRQNGVFPSISDDGVLVYLSLGDNSRQLVWVDRDGQRLSEIGQPQQRMSRPRLSPDGRSVAVSGAETGETDIWIHETGRPIKTRFTFSEAIDRWPVWSPDGQELAFSSLREGYQKAYVKSVTGTSQAKKLSSALSGLHTVDDWSQNGRYMIVREAIAGEVGSNYWYLERGDGGEWEARPYFQSEFVDRIAVFSPDASYVAFVSNESGRDEVYVKPFPSGPGKWKVSENGGAQPRWVGEELFYVESDALYSASVSVAAGFTVISTERLFRDPSLVQGNAIQSYDVAPDGKKFVLVDTITEGGGPTLHVVQNWHEEFRDRE